MSIAHRNITTITHNFKSRRVLKSYKMDDITMEKWECPCGYIYDPVEGDYENGVEPETAFEDLPDNWVCPKCGAEKEDFYKAD